MARARRRPRPTTCLAVGVLLWMPDHSSVYGVDAPREGQIPTTTAFEALTRLGPSSPRWRFLSNELQRLLATYPEVHRRELNKGVDGRFVFVSAESHGIGNRVNSVVGAFAIALLTQRALVIGWDSRAVCAAKAHEAAAAALEKKEATEQQQQPLRRGASGSAGVVARTETSETPASSSGAVGTTTTPDDYTTTSHPPKRANLTVAITTLRRTMNHDRLLREEEEEEEEKEDGRRRLPIINGVSDETCDPVRIDDLFDAPDGIDWRGETLPKELRGVAHACPHKKPSPPWATWVMRNGDATNDFRKLFDADLGSTFMDEFKVLCVHSDRPFVWAVTCNPKVRDVFPPPWAAYGALQDYLLLPSAPVRDRARRALRGGYRCRAGVHLRKVRNPDHSKLVADFLRAMHSNNHRPNSEEGAEEDDRKDTDLVFVASDPFSVAVRREIADLVAARGFRLLEPPALSAHPTRSTIEGILDAGVENAILALCDSLLPFESGHSTYHDIALARLVWRRQLDADAVTLHIGNHTEHRQTVSPPISTCYHPWQRDDGEAA